MLPNKYASSSSLQTATTSYSLGYSDSSSGLYIPCISNCSWETYTNNSQFEGSTDFRGPFDPDDDRIVTDMSSQLACVPNSFGYSKEKGAIVFPPFDSPPCEDVRLTEPRPDLNLDTETGLFTMKCPPGVQGRYILHPKELPSTHQYFNDEMKRFWKVEKYADKPVSTGDGEFVYGSCGKEFTNAVLRPKFRPEVHARAKKIMLEKGKNTEIRPMIVLFLAVDSFSRRHFYRKMPKTVAFLNKINAEREFTVFDFKVHNVVQKHSPENMLPMFVNKTLPYKSIPDRKETTGKYSLWQIAKGLGYVTHLSFESCGSNFIHFMGRELTVDHHVSTFFCAAETFIQSSLSSGASERKCIGPHWAHYHLLNYTYEVSHLYRGLNQFHYLHLEGAHDSSGQFAGTLDNDLLEFLEAYIRTFAAGNDLAIMIQGDHGMRFGNWHKEYEADQEMKLPIMYLIAQTKLLERLPYSFDALWHNSFRLVSKRDFRATILALLPVPYGEEYPVHEETYLSKAYILHREKVKDSRECGDANVDPWYCSCLKMTEEIPNFLIHSYQRSDIERLLLEITTETVRLINEKVLTTNNIPPGMICRKISFEGILKAYGFSINSKVEQIKVEFSINELQSARIEAIAIIGSDDQNYLFDRSRDWYSIEPYIYIGFPADVRVLST